MRPTQHVPGRIIGEAQQLHAEMVHRCAVAAGYQLQWQQQQQYQADIGSRSSDDSSNGAGGDGSRAWQGDVDQVCVGRS